VPGKNIHLDYRHAEGRPERLDELARELVRLGVDVIVARSSLAISAARRATTTIPIVMSATGLDPIEAGFVTSLARPDGNVTGLTLLTRALEPKQLQILKEVVPRLSRVGVLRGASGLTPNEEQDLEAAAGGLQLQLHHVTVRHADDLEKALPEVHRRSAFYVDRLLRGARPADLPVEEPARLFLLVNAKSARAIGLTLPPAVRARADEIIQ
jgi:putative ABC transport system substrate-binding protein